MLQQLIIHNFTIADSLEIDFKNGMHALTGETGAGKSISLDALSLVSGARADTHYIKAGQSRAEIHAVFDISNFEPAQKWLQKHELHDESLGAHFECILRRVINRDGASRAYINGRPSSLVQVQELAGMLINIHGQHAQQYLLQRKQQRELLDRFAQAQAYSKQVRILSQHWLQLQEEIQTLHASEEQRLSQLELLNYQLEELEQLKLEDGEVDKLEAEQKSLSQADSIIVDCEQALEMCYDNDENNTVQWLVSRSLQMLEKYRDNPELKNSIELLSQVKILTEEANQELRHFKDHFNADPERLQNIEDRLDSVYQLARKHRVEADALHTHSQALQQEIDTLQNSNQQLQQLETELEQTFKDYQLAAQKLSKLRQKAAKKLQTSVTSQLEALHMPGASLLVELESVDESQPSPLGLESPQFLIRTNAGQEYGSLKQIASGGELSRISLAIEVATLATSTTHTLIFDEVDAGIGGATAEVVGDLLQQLSSNKQIICVTHQAQIAAKAQHHYCVSKINNLKKNTVSAQIRVLDAEQRIEEISRMIGGVSITQATRSHAQEMLKISA